MSKIFPQWRLLSFGFLVLGWLLTGTVAPAADGPTAPAEGGDTETADHARLIAGWGPESRARGEKLYHTLCLPCHGTPGQPGSLPASRAFWREPFKNGNEPLSIYRTIGTGLGQMPAWPWLSAEMRYDVIHFIREEFVKPQNPANYFAVTPAYLAGLPKAGTVVVARKSTELVEFEKGPKYLRMDFGPVLNWTYQVEPGNIAYKGVAVRVDEGSGGVSQGHAWMLFDHDTMRMAAAWVGDQFVDWKGIAFDASHQTHTSIVGDRFFTNPVGPGWADPATGGFADPRIQGVDHRPYGPLPKEWTNFQGTYVSGRRVVIAYTVGDTQVYESPGSEGAGNNQAFSRTLNVGPVGRDLCLRLAPTNVPVALVGESRARLEAQAGFHCLRIPAGTAPLRVKVLLGHAATNAEPARVLALAALSDDPEDLASLRQGGKAAWNRDLITHGALGATGAAYEVDTIAYPEGEENPWHSWMRLGGFDFFADGRRAAVCTWNGDVWLVSGVDGDLREVQWRRIAAGLFQPLGLKIVDETIYVTCRDQIVRLHDLNGDGETDFYECFNNDQQVTEHFHEFAMGLQTDKAGNFYYAKGGRHALPAVVPQHGTLIKVSRDGAKSEIVAHGFRAPNGVCVNDDGTFFITDQEGHWTPKNRIDLVRPGKFYGYMWAYDHPVSGADDQMEPPVVWITNDMDRSPAEIVRVTGTGWGPLQGQIVNISYGMGRIFLAPMETVRGQIQGGVIQLPIPDFPTGIMRGRFHPGNGQLYVCGMVGWASNQHQDGGFYRVRYTGKPAYLPVGLHAGHESFAVAFTDALAPEAAELPTNYSVRVWNLKRSANYGSPHVGEHPVTVTAAKLEADGKTVRLTLPGLAPTQGMEIKCSLKGKNGESFTRTIHNTILALPSE